MAVKDEQWFENYLRELLDDIIPTELQEKTGIESPDTVTSFEEMGVLTNNKGLVVKFNDGSEFQVTIVQSKTGESHG